MPGTSNNGLVERMVGAARLNVETYEEIERDEDASLQAFAVVVLVAVASGLGLLFVDGISGLFGGIARAIYSWIIFAMVAYFVGAKLFPESQTHTSPDELMRTTGFAQTPGLLGIFTFVPIVGWLIAIGAWIWTIVAVIVGLRQALDTTTGRTIGIAVISLLVIFIISLLVSAIGLTFVAR